MPDRAFVLCTEDGGKVNNGRYSLGALLQRGGIEEVAFDGRYASRSIFSRPYKGTAFKTSLYHVPQQPRSNKPRPTCH